jgi:hypothetical protein
VLFCREYGAEISVDGLKLRLLATDAEQLRFVKFETETWTIAMPIGPGRTTRSPAVRSGRADQGRRRCGRRSRRRSPWHPDGLGFVATDALPELERIVVLEIDRYNHSTHTQSAAGRWTVISRTILVLSCRVTRGLRGPTGPLDRLRPSAKPFRWSRPDCSFRATPKCWSSVRSTMVRPRLRNESSRATPPQDPIAQHSTILVAKTQAPNGPGIPQLFTATHAALGQPPGRCETTAERQRTHEGPAKRVTSL